MKSTRRCIKCNNLSIKPANEFPNEFQGFTFSYHKLYENRHVNVCARVCERDRERFFFASEFLNCKIFLRSNLLISPSEEEMPAIYMYEEIIGNAIIKTRGKKPSNLILHRHPLTITKGPEHSAPCTLKTNSE